MVAVPWLCGVTVRSGVALQLVKVADEGLTVATDELLDEIETTRVVEPVRLHPFFPSPFRATTTRFVVPLGPPTLSGMISATASTVGSSVFEMSSARATVPSASAARAAPRIKPKRLFLRALVFLATVLSSPSLSAVEKLFAAPRAAGLNAAEPVPV
jgi:hypothetical protein